MVRTFFSIAAVIACLSLPGLAQAQSSSRDPKPAKAAAMVNLNTATAAELEALPGIGSKVAVRIVEYRREKGSFKKVEELMNVQGIGEKSFLKLRGQLTVGATKPDPANQ